MNIAIFVGVMLEKPTLAKKDNYLSTFKIMTLEENEDEAVQFNCLAKNNVGYELYIRGETGKCFLMSGRILFNKTKNSNYIEVTSFMDLTPAEPLVPLSIKTFLELYKPEKVMENLKETAKQQRKERARTKSTCEDIPQEDIEDLEEDNTNESSS